MNDWLVLFDEKPETPDAKEGEDNVSGDDLVTALKELKESVALLDTHLTEKETEVSETEVTTEEVTEEPIPEEELPVQKKDINALKDSVDGLSQNVDKVGKLLTAENTTEEATTEQGLTYLDETVDKHLYLTSKVENASINDVYTMTLSIRNICALALLLAVSLFLVKGIRTALERLLNR